MKRHAEELKGWLTKWFGMQLGTITGFVFVDTDDLEDFLEALEKDPAKAYTLCTYRGPLLDALNSFPVIKLFNLLVGEVVASLIYRAGLSCILVLDFDVERFCCVCDGKEKWACVFRTRERDTKALISHMFSILGCEERSYRYTGSRIFRENVYNWLKESVEKGVLNYVWIRNEFEKGELASRESNLLVKSIQNWFEDKTFSSCVFTWWFGKVGVLGLNYLNKVTYVLSASGKESDNREFSEIFGEIYDAYVKGIELKDEEVKRKTPAKETGIVKDDIGSQVSMSLTNKDVVKDIAGTLTAKNETVAAEPVRGVDKTIQFDLFGKKLVELEERIKNLERETSRIKNIDGKLGQMEA
ncbi:MAG: hypothetical protein QXV37_03250, partial [Candidatus Jordarchaeaceae archaeon]